jgi:hypothetical protein
MMLKELLDNVIAINRSTSQTPTFLSLIGQESREITHSAFIAALLDPNGVHGQGTLFLRSFVDIFVPSMVASIDYESVKVEVEKSLGEEGVDKLDNPIGGRIDIYLEDKNNNVIVVENKIYAPDREKQLCRYWNSICDIRDYSYNDCSNRAMVYLTLDGHLPSKKSMCNLPNKFVTIRSYQKHVKNWLQSCLSSVTNDGYLKNIIEQYIKTINALTMDYKIVKVITKSSNNMAAALSIMSSIDKARNAISERFMLNLNETFKERTNNLDNPKVVKDLYKDNEGWHFHIQSYSQTIDICIAWRLFIRVMTPKDKLNDKASKDRICETVLTKSLGWNRCEESNNWAWKYIRINGQLMDFHDFTTPSLDYLDNSANIVKAAYLEIIRIITHEFKFS